jgi:transglutaminase-like putative cysteine protease
MTSMLEEILPYFHDFEGLSNIDRRIAIFNRVRDIPYAVIPELRNPYIGPLTILKMNKGSCSPKHFLLGELYENMGIRTRYFSYPVYWKDLIDMGIELPSELLKMAKNYMILDHHLCIKIQIDRKWILVDATWDLPLKKVGFPVNENWDGLSDTKLAVDSIEEAMNEGAEGRYRYVLEKEKEYTREYIEKRDEFYHALNKWMMIVRQTNN